MISRTTVWDLAAFLVLGSIAFAAGGQNGSKSEEKDPITNVLSQGVDEIEGSTETQATAFGRRDNRYILEIGDVLNLEFQFTPDFNQTATVQPDGYITLKDIGDLRVEGKTVPRLREELQRAYANILANPVIDISLKEFEKPYFLTLGQVAHPGKYDLRGATSVAAAVAMAGGFTPVAKHSQVLLFRRVSDKWAAVKKIDLKHMLQSGNLTEDLYLSPGDLIYVPQNTVSKIKPFVPLPSLGLMAPIP